MSKAVFPVHRWDAATTGLSLWTHERSATTELSELFKNRQMKKTYNAVVRGYTDSRGTITLPLEFNGAQTPAETHYTTLKQIELPHAIGTRYRTARYSLVEVKPTTGRWHQIRRHFDRIGHPLLGDHDHGDSHHNRFFRDHLKLPGLCLRATELQFIHPWTKEEVHLQAPATEKWKKIHSLFT